MPVQTSAVALRQMFMAAGFPAAKDWDQEKLTDNLFKINDIIADDAEIVDEESKSLAAELMVAVGKGELVEVDWGASTGEEPASEEPAAAPEKKPAKGKNKEKKVAANKKADKGKPDKAPAKAKGDKAKADSPGRGYRIFGHSSTSVIHWMAQKGADFDKAKKVLSKFKITEISDENLRARLSVGRSKERAKPAKLSKDEAEQILKLIK